jgi:Domain of unknown function (DUF4279)
MSGSATSTTKSEPSTLIASASLIFAGDRLDPDRITTLLDVRPTTAYRKGEVYKRSRGHEVIGRTGLWLLSSRGHLKSDELNDHLVYLKAIVFPTPTGANDLVVPLKMLMRADGLTAELSCFWYGEHGASEPEIPEDIRAAFSQIGATIETDFDTD